MPVHVPEVHGNQARVRLKNEMNPGKCDLEGEARNELGQLQKIKDKLEVLRVPFRDLEEVQNPLKR